MDKESSVVYTITMYSDRSRETEFEVQLNKITESNKLNLSMNEQIELLKEFVKELEVLRFRKRAN